MKKLVVVLFAFLGAWIVAPMFFPSLLKTAVVVHNYNIPWLYFLTGAVFLCAYGLKGK
jgi:hypothetical protein